MLSMFRSHRSGLTMIELLVVVAILATVFLIAVFSVQKYMSRSRDATRKTHLEKYRIALEEYHNDKGRYPESSVFLNCGSGDLKPYLPTVYCDPLTGQPYYYQTNAVGNEYIIYVHLDAEDDPVIATRGCSDGCGPDDNGDGVGDYNYGISSWQAVTGSSVARLEYTPTCGSQSSPTCIPGGCGTCCPGALRCNGTGTGCFVDLTCSAP